MPDHTKLRHLWKVVAECDEDQIELVQWFAHLARDGYTDDQGNAVAPDPAKAQHCEDVVAVLTECRDFAHTIAPDLPRDVETPL